MALLPSSGVSPPITWIRKKTIFWNVVVLYFIFYPGRWTKSKRQLVLNVIYRRQNHLEFDLRYLKLRVSSVCIEIVKRGGLIVCICKVRIAQRICVRVTVLQIVKHSAPCAYVSSDAKTKCWLRVNVVENRNVYSFAVLLIELDLAFCPPSVTL